MGSDNILSHTGGAPAFLDGTIASSGEGVPPHEENLFAADVDAIDDARTELNVQLMQLHKTDTLVDKLLEKATDQRPNSRLERAVAELLQSQDAAQDVAHQANKLYKFKKNKDGSSATVNDLKVAATEVQDQINIMLADTKAVRAQMPKVGKTDKPRN